MGKRVVIVEDDKDIVELLIHHLEREGYEVKAYYDGNTALKELTKSPPDLVILDLMLPEIDGLEVCRLLRKNARTANVLILILTAKDTETDKVVGLELGADDYVIKPFSPRELTARVKALLRRKTAVSSVSQIMRFGPLEIDQRAYQCSLDGKAVSLTATEFRILSYLARRAGDVITREQLLEYLWEGDKAVYDRTIDFHIARLRAKLAPYSFIQTVRGVGYKFNPVP
ncbi:MAG: response regulator transcription factor [bacterium]